MTGRTKRTKREHAFRSSAGSRSGFPGTRSREATVTASGAGTGTGELLELPARHDQALDVFNHLFAHAARAGASRSEPALAAKRSTTSPTLPEHYPLLADVLLASMAEGAASLDRARRRRRGGRARLVAEATLEGAEHARATA